MAYYITKNPGYVAGRREEARRKKEKVLPRRDVGDVGLLKGQRDTERSFKVSWIFKGL